MCQCVKDKLFIKKVKLTIIDKNKHRWTYLSKFNPGSGDITKYITPISFDWMIQDHVI